MEKMKRLAKEKMTIHFIKKKNGFLEPKKNAKDGKI